MNNVIMAGTMPSAEMATCKEVPRAGELWIDPKTNNAKIGDGKTMMFELPWISLNNIATTKPPQESKLPDHVKRFIEAHIDLITREDFNRMYDSIVTDELKRSVTVALLKAGIDPSVNLNPVPRCIQDILIGVPGIVYTKHIYTGPPPKVDYDDLRVLTKAEVDAKLHEVTEAFTKKMYNAMGIPYHLATIKIGE